MAKMSTTYFENLIDKENTLWEEERQKPRAQIQCLAGIVLLLAELIDGVEKQNEILGGWEQIRRVSVL